MSNFITNVMYWTIQRTLPFPSLKIVFTGRAAHAAGFPWEGLNALDAAVACYNNVSMLRQQMKPTWFVHGDVIKANDDVV